eukprot:2699236-Rhodomonas_salina.1
MQLSAPSTTESVHGAWRAKHLRSEQDTRRAGHTHGMASMARAQQERGNHGHARVQTAMPATVVYRSWKLKGTQVNRWTDGQSARASRADGRMRRVSE